MFEPGDRVIWAYTHRLNRKSRLVRIKHGAFIRYVYTRTRRSSWGQKCLVHFDGNKNPSTIYKHELEKENEDA